MPDFPCKPLFVSYYNIHVELSCSASGKANSISIPQKSLGVLKPKETPSVLSPMCTHFLADLTGEKKKKEEEKMHAPVSLTSEKEKRPAQGAHPRTHLLNRGPRGAMYRTSGTRQ